MRILERALNRPPERTLVEVLRATAASHPDDQALDDGRVALSYRDLLSATETVAERLATAGVVRGDRVGIRMPSGAADLYVAILGVLTAGASYVPVDLDDPQERADLVFGTAEVRAVLSEGSDLTMHGDVHPEASSERGPAERGPAELGPERPGPAAPEPDDDAWVIFTSGSTGVPKGVAVTHRSAAAFVDAEARLFLKDDPLGPGDRVLAGLSVAFDASCEEMWLAWRHGACLVPAPRALVRSGMDLAPWLVDRGITAVSTVPTLASLWPPSTLDAVRLLIFGGEVCPPELVERLAVGEREVWNTYGPTEATVVSCAARLRVGEPVRIGLPLDGWDLAVVDKEGGGRVSEGEIGELIIGGVGLARYLDEAKSARSFAPMPSLGWHRAYRSGDLVRQEAQGLVFVGRGDDQVKVGGRRIELGEVDAALIALDGVAATAAAVRTTEAGNKVLVGYLTLLPGAALDRQGALDALRVTLPASLVPLLAVVDDIPTRTSGKVDRDSLPWPLASVPMAGTTESAGLTGTARWLAGLWARVLGTTASDGSADFFLDGGSSLSAAQLVAALRERYPQVTVADVYENPRLDELAERLAELIPVGDEMQPARAVQPLPRRAQAVQQLVALALTLVPGARWLTWAAAGANVLAAAGGPFWLPVTSWWWLLTGWVLLVSPWGRMGMTVLLARLLLRGVRPGRFPRGGSVHLRLWAAEAAADVLGATNLSGAPWIPYYARALGAEVGPGVDLHAVPPVTGLMTLGRGASVAPEVDLSGHWLDGDVLHIGRVRIDAGASVGSRSTLLPSVRVGQDAEVAPGSSIAGSVPPGERWGGSPAVFAGVPHRDWPSRRPPRRLRWVPVYVVTSAALACLPLVSAAAGLAVLWPSLRETTGADDAVRAAALLVPATLVALAAEALLTLLFVRLLGVGVRAGFHPVRSRTGWQVWATERLMDDARSYLYPFYASLVTPIWLRALGARIGHGVEVSTVLMLPAMTTVGDHAFLADDTLIGSYELARGWLRIERAKVGKRAFLGNSGMAGPGRVVRKNSLVAVLSAAPQKAKSGTSWLGSPPVQLRRSVASGDESRTFTPPTTVKAQRAMVELCRLVPIVVSAGLGLGFALILVIMLGRWGGLVSLAIAGPLLFVVGIVAALVATAAKWALVGRHRAVEHPLWSSFVWRNELADAFVELVAVPWFVRGALATPAFVLWLRSLGARIGRGVWCETYWLPEPDLVRLGDGATVNRGCVLQTHLFHDRIMSMDTVTLHSGAALGPQSVILPAASLGEGATVGPASLVLRGDEVPAGSRWFGNPIAPWV